jgi:hypothetical protein
MVFPAMAGRSRLPTTNTDTPSPTSEPAPTPVKPSMGDACSLTGHPDTTRVVERIAAVLRAEAAAEAKDGQP